ncbi:unnamed protein product [Eruca vesicaria subsp. sativa]|uniref:Uncharacterized protein n=1 Tax=Eruca vesicaria subsp. sativa TaxID=29727 RepID=A0ABC8JLB1_ERUVS|nr:unnamed protein product [Eruca vesicaria subsp. sativa]
MDRVVRLLKGQWSKSQQVQDNEPIEDLKGMVRSVFNITPQRPLLVMFQLRGCMLEPDSDTCPPHKIVTNSDVEMVMSVQDFNTQPRLCIIFGAQDVSRYQFICREPFTIGAITFLGDGITKEEHLFAIQDLVRGKELRFSEDVLTDIYNEEKLVLIIAFPSKFRKQPTLLTLMLSLLMVIPTMLSP